MKSELETEPINGAALVDELREVFGCEVSLTPAGKVSLLFPAERLVDEWMVGFIKAHMGELRAALVDEAPVKNSSMEQASYG